MQTEHPDKVAERQEKATQYHTFGGEETEQALAGYAAALQGQSPVIRGKAASTWFNIAPNNVSVRDGFDRHDYERFRPEEAIPKEPKDLMGACVRAAESVGIIDNMISLMVDFACKGIEISHPNVRIQKLYREWWKRVGAVERSKQFLLSFFTAGMTAVERATARITLRQENDFKKAAGADLLSEPKTRSRIIPIRYIFKNPLSLTLLIDEDFFPLLGDATYLYGVQIPPSLCDRIKMPRSEGDKLAISKLPPELVAKIKAGATAIPLSEENSQVFYYRKMDWKCWPRPMIAGILPDLIMLQKMKLADLAALDGAISAIRIWKLGSIEAKILPSEAVMLQLAGLLNNNVSGGTMDLVWGPDLELLETSTEAYKFLGEAKYKPILRAIYSGMGISPAIDGSEVSSNTTGNALSLKMLTERIQHGRDALQEFWQTEARYVQRAMSFRASGTVSFDNVLSDEVGEKQLYVGLYDRGLISIETLQERFGMTPEVEQFRIERDKKLRERGKLAPQASPFHNPQHKEGLEKIFAQSGAFSPAQFGLDLEPHQKGDVIPGESVPQTSPDKKPAGDPNGGRPPGSKDKQKRQRGREKPKTGKAVYKALAAAVTGQEILATVTAEFTPIFLQFCQVENCRRLTAEQDKQLEQLKLSLLFSFAEGDEINRETILAKLSSLEEVPPLAKKLVEKATAVYLSRHGCEPPLEVVRNFYGSVYGLLSASHSEGEIENGEDCSGI